MIRATARSGSVVICSVWSRKGDTPPGSRHDRASEQDDWDYVDVSRHDRASEQDDWDYVDVLVDEETFSQAVAS